MWLVAAGFGIPAPFVASYYLRERTPPIFMGLFPMYGGGPLDRFSPEPIFEPDSDIELEVEETDTMFHDGRVIDLGEAVAQTLALAIDPFPRSPDAEEVLQEAGLKDETPTGPFAALAALRKGTE